MLTTTGFIVEVQSPLGVVLARLAEIEAELDRSDRTGASCPECDRLLTVEMLQIGDALDIAALEYGFEQYAEDATPVVVSEWWGLDPHVCLFEVH